MLLLPYIGNIHSLMRLLEAAKRLLRDHALVRLLPVVKLGFLSRLALCILLVSALLEHLLLLAERGSLGLRGKNATHLLKVERVCGI